MDELIIIEYLKRKGLYNMSEKEFDDKFKEVMYQHYMKNYKSEDSTQGKEIEEELLEDHKSAHFNESYAKYIVSTMWHYSNSKKCVGEKYDMIKAKEIRERYRGTIPSSITCSDVYVAINSHYHNYINLYKSWFGDNVDQKIIESAIMYWFQDDDYSGDSKLWKITEK